MCNLEWFPKIRSQLAMIALYSMMLLMHVKS